MGRLIEEEALRSEKLDQKEQMLKDTDKEIKQLKLQLQTERDKLTIY